VFQSQRNKKKVTFFILSSSNVMPVAFSNGWMNWGSLWHPPQAVKGQIDLSGGDQEGMHSV
jgi:hypothetical protein